MALLFRKVVDKLKVNSKHYDIHNVVLFFFSSYRLKSARESGRVVEDTTVLHPHSFTGAMVKKNH